MKKMKSVILSSVVICGCSTVNSNRDRQPAFNQNIDSRVVSIVGETMGVDAHNHVDVPLVSDQLPGPSIDLAGELKKSGLTTIGMTFAVDYQKLTKPGQAYERFLNGLTAMDAALKENNITRALNADDIETARMNNQPIVIQSVEGGHFLEGKIDRLKVAYGRGLRHFGILHDNDASPALGDVFTNKSQWGGLTKFGAQVIKESERLGILVDLSHCDNKTIDMALKVAKKPIIISHTGLNTQLGNDPKFAEMMKPRLISKEQAKKVADKGGIICVWTHLADTPAEFAANIRAMVNVVGVDHVCIGTDTKLTKAYKDPNDPHKGPSGERLGERTNLAWKDQQSGFYYTVVQAMLDAGFNEEEIGKVGGGNYLRIFKQAITH